MFLYFVLFTGKVNKCKFDGKNILVNCPAGTRIKIVSSILLDTNYPNTEWPCHVPYDPYCYVELGEEELRDIKRRCDNHAQCTVWMIRKQCPPGRYDNKVTDFQSVTYSCEAGKTHYCAIAA